MIIICGHIFANLTAESVRDVLQLEDFTTYLGIYAASRVIRYPELRELLADPIAQHWASLTGITSTARNPAAARRRHRRGRRSKPDCPRHHQPSHISRKRADSDGTQPGGQTNLPARRGHRHLDPHRVRSRRARRQHRVSTPHRPHVREPTPPTTRHCRLAPTQEPSVPHRPVPIYDTRCPRPPEDPAHTLKQEVTKNTLRPLGSIVKNQSHHERDAITGSTAATRDLE